VPSCDRDATFNAVEALIEVYFSEIYRARLTGFAAARRDYRTLSRVETARRDRRGVIGGDPGNRRLPPACRAYIFVLAA
jgi:hypothetical protein